jgi:hypothetical protein
LLERNRSLGDFDYVLFATLGFSQAGDGQECPSYDSYLSNGPYAFSDVVAFPARGLARRGAWAESARSLRIWSSCPAPPDRHRSRRTELVDGPSGTFGWDCWAMNRRFRVHNARQSPNKSVAKKQQAYAKIHRCAGKLSLLCDFWKDSISPIRMKVSHREFPTPMPDKFFWNQTGERTEGDSDGP